MSFLRNSMLRHHPSTGKMPDLEPNPEAVSCEPWETLQKVVLSCAIPVGRGETWVDLIVDYRDFETVLQSMFAADKKATMMAISELLKAIAEKDE
jgi:hypothetical protein